MDVFPILHFAAMQNLGTTIRVAFKKKKVHVYLASSIETSYRVTALSANILVQAIKMFALDPVKIRAVCRWRVSTLPGIASLIFKIEKFYLHIRKERKKFNIFI